MQRRASGPSKWIQKKQRNLKNSNSLPSAGDHMDVYFSFSRREGKKKKTWGGSGCGPCKEFTLSLVVKVGELCASGGS